MSDTYWEHFPHEADVGVRGVAESEAGAFEQAALALTAVIVDPATVNPSEPVTVTLNAPDRELLLVDWLNALIYEMATRGMLFGRYEVDLVGDDLRAHAWGEPLDRRRHDAAVEIKGATYTALRVWRGDDGLWRAQCVVDV